MNESAKSKFKGQSTRKNKKGREQQPGMQQENSYLEAKPINY